MIAHPRRLLLLCALLLPLAGPPVRAADEPTPAVEAADDAGVLLPPGLEIRFEGTLTQTEDGGVVFSGPVTMTWRETRFQADRMTLRDRRYVEAEGNVLIVWGRNRLFGARATYDLQEERGVIEDAMGSTLDEYLFWAESVEKIGDDKLLLRSAVVTTCTQPVPYWSFAISSARIRLEKYARMRNVRLRGGHMPLVYLPYLVWPVKEGRAAGLLMPEFNTTSTRGRAVTQQLFIPLGRSADVTLLGRYYTKAGFGGGGELRFIPNQSGSGIFSGFFINDSVSGTERYRADYRQTQNFQNGFRMVADIGVVSDPSYFSDFERDLNTTSNPQTLARLEFSRNGPWASMNVRELRREQLSTGLVQQTLPEVEWRGRSRRLWKSPFYLAFQSSLASIQQRRGIAGEPDFLDADYLRGDVEPVVTVPFSPTAWLDVTPRVAYRYTYYTQQADDDGQALDQSLSRQLWSYGVEIVGPKLFRVFRRNSPSRYKHTIEPRISYGFSEAFTGTEDVLLYDEVDSVSGSGRSMNYALVQRLFARRPQAEPEGPVLAAETILLADGTTYDPSAPKEETVEEQAAPAATVPVEIASLTLSQTRSFEENISSADTDGDGIVESFSKASAVSMTGRINPNPAVSLDLRGSYDILFNSLADVSLSGVLRSRLSSLRFSVFHRRGLGFFQSTDAMNNPIFLPVEDSTQARLTAGLSLLQDRLQLKMDASYTADPAPGQSHVPDQRWQVQYSTQCCTVLVERLTRAFATATTPNDRRELHFRIDLRGVGKLLSQTF